ncbi:1435_t:CDS:2 [Acaulospora morrowiae]|uniref:1435_t:CDS:1 n=1 Tax=Acaulospora morrowiae TaxID=94023 RepID=A0A9N9FKE8_9GLOM|nr:1435_t:CDS:2 [Acaulospora morrowiae]
MAGYMNLNSDKGCAYSVALIKEQLESRLNKNANQIQIAAKSNTALVKQQIKLEERIQELDRTEGDKVSQALKDRLVAFEQEMKALDVEIFQGTRVLLKGTNIPTLFDSTTKPESNVKFTPKEKNKYGKNQKKSSKVDIELAENIGQGLVQEIRRLKERVRELEINKAELEHNIEILTGRACSTEEIEDFIIVE